jgi:hypothetical protein
VIGIDLEIRCASNDARRIASQVFEIRNAAGNAARGSVTRASVLATIPASV